MGFWRKEVIDSALDQETRRNIDEQLAWIGREPRNARPYFNLAQLYRMQSKTAAAAGLLLEAVSLDDSCADAHNALTEIYAVAGDYPAAWRHARAAEREGDTRGVDLLTRYGVCE